MNPTSGHTIASPPVQGSRLFGATPPLHRIRARLFAFSVLTLALAPAAVVAQSGEAVRVGLEVTERTGSPVGEAFGSTVATMNGVEPVERGSAADYFLTVAVLCVPQSDDCAGAESYSVSVTLSEPLGAHELSSGLAQTGERALADWEPTAEAGRFLQQFRRMHAVWSTLWARESADASIARLLRSVDARCFQQRRVIEAERAVLMRRGDTTAARALTMDRSRGRDWLC